MRFVDGANRGLRGAAARHASSPACELRSALAPRIKIGKPTTSMSNEYKITADAMKIARSRPSSGVPFSNVIAPRTPPMVVSASMRMARRCI